jgi:hypothetical protein
MYEQRSGTEEKGRSEKRGPKFNRIINFKDRYEAIFPSASSTRVRYRDTTVPLNPAKENVQTVPGLGSNTSHTLCFACYCIVSYFLTRVEIRRAWPYPTWELKIKDLPSVESKGCVMCQLFLKAIKGIFHPLNQEATVDANRCFDSPGTVFKLSYKIPSVAPEYVEIYSTWGENNRLLCLI